MILRLRQRHRRVFAVLVIFLPAAAIIGIAERKPVQPVAELPAALAAGPQQFGVVEWERDDLFPKSPVRVRLLRAQGGADRRAIGISAAEGFLKPDLLVYWSEGNPALTGTLPDSALLLGAFDVPVLPVPDGAGRNPGVLVLYSLADGEIADVSRPIALEPDHKATQSRMH